MLGAGRTGGDEVAVRQGAHQIPTKRTEKDQGEDVADRSISARTRPPEQDEGEPAEPPSSLTAIRPAARGLGLMGRLTAKAARAIPATPYRSEERHDGDARRATRG